MLEPTPPVPLTSSSPPHTPSPHACSPQPLVLVSGISLSATSAPAFAVPVALTGVMVKFNVPSPSSPNVPIPPVACTPVALGSLPTVELLIVPVPTTLEIVPVDVSKLSVPVSPVPETPPFGRSNILSCSIVSVPVALVA